MAADPKHLSPAEGTSIWMQYITVYGVIEFGGLKKGDQFVITAATSRVGIAAIQIAKFVGAISIATMRNKAKGAVLTDAGADFVVDSSRTARSKGSVIPSSGRIIAGRPSGILR